MRPPDQRLRAGHRPRFEMDLRLVVEDELPASKCAMQAGFDPLPLDSAGVHLRLEEPIAVPATFLGVVHRCVGGLDQFLRIRTVVGIDADPDGGGDMQLVVRDLVRRDERGDDFLRAGGRIVGVLDLGQHQNEFIPAQAADRVRAPDAPHEAPRHGLQQPVAHYMSQAVVHVLEPIQIEEQHGQAMAMAAGEGNRLGEPIAQQHAVGQVGQKVVLGQIDGPQRHRPHFAHVFEHDHRADHLSAAIVDGRRGVFDRRLEPVTPDEQAGRSQIDGSIELDRPAQRIPRRFAGRRVEDREHLRERPAQCLLTRPARHAFGHPVEIRHVAVDIGAEHGVADRVEGRFRALLFEELCFVRRFALDDVPESLR